MGPSPLLSNPNSTTPTTPEPPKDPPHLTPPTGLAPEATFAPPKSSTPVSSVPSTWRASGESSFNTSLKDTDTATTTTPKPPASKHASSPKAPAVCWPPVTSPSALRSTSTTVLSPWTPVTPTEDSSSIPTNSPAPVPATSPNKPLPFPNQRLSKEPITPPPIPLPRQVFRPVASFVIYTFFRPASFINYAFSTMLIPNLSLPTPFIASHLKKKQPLT